MTLKADVVFVGDPHGELVRAVEAILHMDELPKAVMLLGDYDLNAPLIDPSRCRFTGVRTRAPVKR